MNLLDIWFCVFTGTEEKGVSVILKNDTFVLLVFLYISILFCITNGVVCGSCFITGDFEVIFVFTSFCVFTGTKLRKNRLNFFTLSNTAFL